MHGGFLAVAFSWRLQQGMVFRNGLVLLEAAAHEMHDLPVFLARRYVFLPGDGQGHRFSPLGWIGQEAFVAGCRGRLVHAEFSYRYPVTLAQCTSIIPLPIGSVRSYA